MRESDRIDEIKIILGKLHEEYSNRNVKSFEPLSAHGSDRNIIRLHSTGGSVIGIFNDNIPENKAFINFTRHFKANGFNVPEIYHVSPDNKSYLMEDLGDMTLFKKICEEKFTLDNIELYKKSIKNLLKFQIEGGRGIDFSQCYQFNEFGNENIDYDLNYFKQRFLAMFSKNKIDDKKLENDLLYLKKGLLEAPGGFFLYRDFQSRNIMLHKNDLYFIDYQSGRKGALQYDIASLLYDAKANIPQEIREELLGYYITKAVSLTNTNSAVFKYYFWFFAVIRILQAMGAYGYLGVTKGRKKFLESIPFALKNILFILDRKIEKGNLGYLKTILTDIKYETSSN